MKIHNLQKFRDKHIGKRIWVCGSGPSLEFIDEKRISKDDIIIACNSSTYHFNKFDYCILTDELANYSNWYLNLINKPCKIILCNSAINKIKKNTTYIEKEYNWKLNKDSSKVIYGYDVIHCAVHIAYVMGASEIILAGVDLKYKTPTQKYIYSQELIDEAPQSCKETLAKGLELGEDSFDGSLGLSLGGWKLINENNNELPIKTISKDTNLTFYPKIDIQKLYV